MAYNLSRVAASGVADKEGALDDDGFDTIKSRKGYTWTYTTPGGALFQGPQWYTTRAAALEAGRQWHKETA